MSADHHNAGGGSVISLAAGSRLAGYRIEERIGQGGMAVVFRALDERLNRTVALKLLAPALASNPELQQRFIGESRAAAAIDDPHIVPVFAAGTADGLLFIAMRYVAGGDARSLLEREGRLPPDRVAAIISPVASALDAAHRAGLVHRDVKPSNMLMDVLPGRPAHVYLSDFGVSKSVAATSGLTAAGAILGTLAYMSPEQVRSQPVDGRSDQYALACSAYELLAGTLPFQRDEPAALMHAQLFEDPPPLSSRRPELAPAVDGVLSRALAKAPEDRYGGCGEFADALRLALGLPPYRPGPRTMDPHPPTEIRNEVRPLGPAADEATVAAVAPTAVDPPQRAAGPGRRLTRRIAVATCVAAAAGLAAGLLLAHGPAAAPMATVPISVKSGLPVETGYVYVGYQDGPYASAEVSGEISKSASGEVIRLYAQQFPFASAPAVADSLIVRSGGRYSFKVSPTLATRYHVAVFRSGIAQEPFAVSGVETIYVAIYGIPADGLPCSGSVCYAAETETFKVPPSALRYEMSKTTYVYSAVNLTKAKNPPTPKLLLLGADDGRSMGGGQQISANEFTVNVAFSFPTGGEHYDLGWNLCHQDTVADDGIGLPGHHRCGDSRIPYDVTYLG